MNTDNVSISPPNSTIALPDKISPERREAFREFLMSTQRTVSPSFFGMFKMDGEGNEEEDDEPGEDEIDGEEYKNSTQMSAIDGQNFSWSLDQYASIYGQNFENVHEMDIFHRTEEEDQEITEFFHSQSSTFFTQNEIISSPRDSGNSGSISGNSQTSLARRNTQEFLTHLNSLSAPTGAGNNTIDMEDQSDTDEEGVSYRFFNDLESTQMSIEEHSVRYVTPKKKKTSHDSGQGNSSPVLKSPTVHLPDIGEPLTTPTNFQRKTPHKWPATLFDFSHLSPIGRRTPFGNLTNTGGNSGFGTVNRRMASGERARGNMRCTLLNFDVDQEFPDISPIVDKAVRKTPQRREGFVIQFDDIDDDCDV